MPAWGRPARWSRSRTATSPAGPARRSRTSSSAGIAATLGVPLEKVRVIWKAGPGSYGRNDADDAPWTPPCSPRRSASRCGCNTCAIRAPAGTRRARPRSTRRAPAFDAAGNITAYEFTSKGFSRVDVDTNGGKPPDTLAGHTRGVRAEVRRRLRRAGGILRVSPTSGSAWETVPPLLDRSSPLRSRICAIRSGRRSTSPANPSSTKWPRPSTSIRSSSGCARQGPARHRGHQGRGGKVRLGAAAVAAQRPDRRQGHGPRHRLCAAQRHPGGGHRRGRRRPLQRQDLGAPLRRRP